jgi:hypothetical protein
MVLSVPVGIVHAVTAVSSGAGSGGGTIVSGFDDAVVAQMLRRASSSGFGRWWSRVENAGFCARPIHLAGVDGLGREQQVLGRCKNRRASVCPSCSDVYAADTWQLIHAGISGGHHGIPDTVAAHPGVFVTLTAPGFGTVHSVHKGASGGARRCHADPGVRSGTGGGECAHSRCRHGNLLWCNAVHVNADAVAGEPLCHRSPTSFVQSCSAERTTFGGF